MDTHLQKNALTLVDIERVAENESALATRFTVLGSLGLPWAAFDPIASLPSGTEPQPWVTENGDMVGAISQFAVQEPFLQ